MAAALVCACGARAELDDQDGAVQLTEGGVSGDPCVVVSGGTTYAVCNGGPNDCFPLDKQFQPPCDGCLASSADTTSLCTTKTFSPSFGIPATDGEVYVELRPPSAWAPVPFDVGTLLAQNGAASSVRYADWTPWTGAPLPSPDTCPSFADFTICGGNCGICKNDEFCTGRSPSHPYGICVPNNIACAQDLWTCPTGRACAFFPETQNRAGFCLTTSGCQNAVTEYPGGIECH